MEVAVGHVTQDHHDVDHHHVIDVEIDAAEHGVHHQDGEAPRAVDHAVQADQGDFSFRLNLVVKDSD